MGADAHTPVAARAAGLRLDMSFDPTQGPAIRSLLQSLREEGPDEGACPTVPLSFVQDYPGHYRPANLTALSFGELRRAMVGAAREKWPYFVILLHSFELVTRAGHRRGPMRPHLINIARWRSLCSFLARHRELFATVGCDDLESLGKSAHLPPVIRTLPLDTAWRMGEQLVSRFI